MLYAIAHFLRDKMPWLWDLVDILNSLLFTLRYGRKMRGIPAILQAASSEYTIVPMAECNTEELVAFFAAQPEEAYTFFRPHGFDAKSLRKLQRNRSFLAYILLDSNANTNTNSDSNSNENDSHSDRPAIVGYCFLRSFFLGKGFRGRMVGIDYRGRGLGTQMNRLLNEVGFSLGLRIFETVNKDNVASYRSALSASNVRVVEEMEGNDLYLEILKE